MKVVNAKEMQDIDRTTINERGIPGQVLMGFAGKSISEFILNNFKNIKKTAVFSGTGNNGGDGFVIAYFLNNSGVDVDLYLIGEKDKVSETSSVYLNLCIKSGINMIYYNNAIENQIEVDKYDLLVDAIFGTGFKGEIKGAALEIVKLLNSSKSPLLAVDIPSGLPASGISPEGDLVRADYTASIGLPKISQVTYPGKTYCGELIVIDIGFPKDLLNSPNIKSEIITPEFFIGKIKRQSDLDTYKSAEGHLLLIGGFENMEGAILMSAMSAVETGVGLISLITAEKSRKIIAGKIPEMITYGIDMESDKKSLCNNLDNFFRTHSYNALVIGPGMGRSKSSKIIFDHVIENVYNYGIRKVLIDGDGLFHLADYLQSKNLDERASFCITPHFSEASKILGYNIDEIKADRIHQARELSRKSTAITLLKGPSTLITDSIYTLINTTGSNALATGGTGDVLSGIIGAFLLRDFSTLHAAGLGAYLHGAACDYITEKENIEYIKATDLIKNLRKVLNGGIQSK